MAVKILKNLSLAAQAANNLFTSYLRRYGKNTHTTHDREAVCEPLISSMQCR